MVSGRQVVASDGKWLVPSFHPTLNAGWQDLCFPWLLKVPVCWKLNHDVDELFETHGLPVSCAEKDVDRRKAYKYLTLLLPYGSKLTAKIN